jgi:membrane protein implicated in regulation of membrane protease activity
VVVVWLVIGVLLVLVEMHHLAFFALFAAIGSFAAALVSVVAPGAIAVQAGVAVGVSAAGLVAVRPFVSQAFAARRGGHVVRGVHGGIVGHEAVTLDHVGDAHRGGHVRLTGERWLAVSGSGRPIGPDTTVVVTAVQGTTLVVWPLDDLELPEAAAELGDGDLDGDDTPDGVDGSET